MRWGGGWSGMVRVFSMLSHRHIALYKSPSKFALWPLWRLSGITCEQTHLLRLSVVGSGPYDVDTYMFSLGYGMHRLLRDYGCGVWFLEFCRRFAPSPVDGNGASEWNVWFQHIFFIQNPVSILGGTG